MHALENVLAKGAYSHYKGIRKYCEPLFSTLNLTAFSYALISQEGKNFALCSNPEHYERYYLDGLFKKDPCCNRAQSMLQTVNLWAGILNREDPEQYAVYEQQVKDNMFNGICIKIETEDGYETYDFATDVKNPAVLNKFINNLPLFNKFITDFKSTYSAIIKKNQDNFISLPEFVGADFFLPVETSSLIACENNSQKQITCTTSARAKHVVKIDKQHVMLTQREYDCLVCLLAGKTAKQTADELCLSYRTVENYLETIKQKTFSRNKIELLSKISSI